MEAIARLAKEISGNPIPWDRGPQPPGAPAGAARAVVGGAPVDAVSQARADLLSARQEAASATEGARALARAWHREAGAAPAGGQPGPAQAPAGTGGGMGIGGVDGTYAARMLRERWEAQQGRQRGHSPAKSGGGASGMPSGQAVGQWFEEQWPTAAPMIDAAMQGAGPASGMSPQQARLSGGTARARAAVPAPAQAAPVGPSATVLAASHRKALAYARGLSASGAPAPQQEAAWQYAAQLEDQLAAANAAGEGPAPAPAGTSGGGGGGILSRLGSRWGGAAWGGALGSAATDLLPIAGPAAIVGAGIAAVSQGYSTYMQQGIPLSNLYHQAATPGQSLIRFMTDLQKTAVTLGYSLSQADEAATALSQGLGYGGTQGLATALAHTLTLSRSLGLSPTATAQTMAVAGQLGVVGIPGSGQKGQMSPQQFAAILSTAVARGNMMGRAGEMLAGLLSVVQGIAANNVAAPNVTSLANIYTAMSATGLPGMRGTAGADLLSRVAQGIASPGLGNVGQFVQMSTMGKGLSLGEYLVAQTQGPGFVNPVTRLTSLQAVMQGLRGWYPGARFGRMPGEAKGGPQMPLNQAATAQMLGLSQLWGISPTQAEALLGMNTSLPPSVMAQIGTTTPLSAVLGELPQLQQVQQAHSLASLRSLAAWYRMHGGAHYLTPHVMHALSQGPVAAARGALTAAMVQHPATILTPAEQNTQALQNLRLQLERLGSDIAPLVRLAEWAMGNTAGSVANDVQAVKNAPATLAHAAQRAWQAGRAAASGQALSVPGAQRWASSVNLVSHMTGMPAAMIAGVMQLESGGHRDIATGGLMQLTAPALASVTGWSAAKARSMVGHLTPWQSLYYGSEYLRQLSQMPRLSGHLGLILSAYNAGPGAVEAAMRQSHSTSLTGMMAYYRAHPYQRPGWMKQEQSALGGPTYAAQVERYITGAAASGFGTAPTAGTGPVELSQQTINALAQAIGAVMKRAGVPDPRRGLR